MIKFTEKSIANLMEAAEELCHARMLTIADAIIKDMIQKSQNAVSPRIEQYVTPDGHRAVKVVIDDVEQLKIANKLGLFDRAKEVINEHI